MDSDAGISIDECAEISRKLGQIVEDQNIVSSAYTLEVSSPGVDFPLGSIRHYTKNIGRKVRTIKKDGVEKIGTLKTITDQYIEIEAVAKKNKGVPPVVWQITFEDITKTQVQVSF